MSRTRIAEWFRPFDVIANRPRWRWVRAEYTAEWNAPPYVNSHVVVNSRGIANPAGTEVGDQWMP